MATIKAIEDRSVHQIQSGQVIVDLISVVKELVENSLDAGATSVEIRFKNQGLDSIEVQDNGKGIAPDDYETVALKHYTSKLSSYEDLTSLDTFGFRGEALSSLCALSKFHIVTARVEDGAVGRKLEFEISGKLKSNSVTAAQRGTTVAVEELFYNLPVRRKELEKNVKREYNKVIAHLHAYACISVGVRFSVTNQMPKGKKVVVFSTKANTTTKENITNVFGTKTLLALVKLDLHLEMEPTTGPSTQSARNWSTQALDRSREVKVEGFISKPVFGEGRQAPDRQMFFVNSRPCGLPQVSKAVNEVYKSFNVSQVPFVFANLVMDTNAYDVNVSPDKRSIMLHDQTALLDGLKSSLTELFEHTDQTVPQSQLPNRKLPSFKPLTVPSRGPAEAESDSDDDKSDDASEGEDSSAVKTPMPASRSHQAANGASPSLIESWIGRDTAVRREPSTKPIHSNGLSKDKEKLVNSMKGAEERSDEPENEETHSVPVGKGAPVVVADAIHDSGHPSITGTATIQAAPLQATREPDPMGPPYDDLFSQRPPQPPAVVENGNSPAETAETEASQSSAETGENPRESVESPPESATSPSEIAISGGTHSISASDIKIIAPASQHITPGPVQNAFDRMRPKRTPAQTAQVTIGDKTTTTVIGSSPPPYKKRRLHQPANSQSIARFGGSPLLARGLRNFAAPGSQLAIDSSDVPQPIIPSQSSDDDMESEDEDDDSAGPHNQDAGSPASPGLDDDELPTSDPLDALQVMPADDDEFDADYMEESDKKILEDQKVARLIHEAEMAAAQPTEKNLKRASQVLKNGGSRKESTLNLVQYARVTTADIRTRLEAAEARGLGTSSPDDNTTNAVIKDEIDDAEAESKLSLTVSKTDFDRMHIVGQFNLGFILAIRPRLGENDQDQLFIIDQHAADEKYNYERLQRTVTLQNQRLVRPKLLDLTAIEEEIILNHGDALKANGFEIETTSDNGDDERTGRSCRLITLPISGEKTFDLSDLEELLHLLSEAPAGSSEIPRPKKVQKMLAMRACRSSIMVGKTLALKQMSKVVKHMGEMEKPWNCPHGRPTMRHLAGLGTWAGWQEGDVVDEEDWEGSQGSVMGGRETDWKGWLAQRG